MRVALQKHMKTLLRGGCTFTAPMRARVPQGPFLPAAFVARGRHWRNTFQNPHADHDAQMDDRELRRGTDKEKQGQLRRLREFQARHKAEAPAALRKLTETALTGGNTFDALMEAVRVCSMGQITKALFEVGGEYRRNT